MNKRYFIVGSDGRPNEVDYGDYQKAMSVPYLTIYEIDKDGTLNVTKQTEETEYDSFPNCG